MSLKDIVALNVRDLRTKADLTQEELSARAGLSAGYIARLESQPQNVTLDVIERLAGVLGCPVEAIVGGKVVAAELSALHLIDEGLELIHRFRNLFSPPS